ncbi:SfnB family sulfur acquisition oxidoreductase [Streptomyces ipomoeae]|uniref:Acyl-CoA dehydrogenase, C-terminal domain protein n=1 Tax=Streptomyces ipomoeae 91-03 TaxID=698759 RepID=L1KJL2_9ACTN|nr:SfnB family sulfur acquisition oxidoreductase [Streptomyces ipomoeae]EKX60749.1 acyl-CoA dehydrogenase, C-terminal domain protein [Streptomyces ipomoeae 91-03]MDX2692023.1 SfnB family sulfur acquisition oxidoreductase [Streptomyces ipomoeae]MDX2837606.1 SfnB family sulfur acquisition oxidoreductase [Streptomyces ipomoeae]
MTHVIADDAEAVAVAAELAAKFAREAALRDAERILPHAELDALSDSGLLGITVPRSHGGAEVSARTLGEVVRLLSAADSSIGQIPQNHFFFVEVLKENGTAEQRDFFYAELLAGRRFGNALAEKGTRHALEFATRLQPRPDGSYTLTGTKNYSTGALFAHWIPVFALAPDDTLTAAFIPHDAPGVTVVDDWDGIGQRGTASGTVRLKDVHVPADRVVPHHLTFERPEVFGAFGQFIHAAVDTGIARAALEEGGELIRTLARPWGESGVDRASEEPLVIQQFGELALLVRAAEALLDRAGTAIDAARRAPADEELAAEASLAVTAARAQADTASLTVANDVFALIGTRSVTGGRGLDRHWRNARTHTLHDPRRWKIQHLGNHALNGVHPPANGIV